MFKNTESSQSGYLLANNWKGFLFLNFDYSRLIHYKFKCQKGVKNR